MKLTITELKQLIKEEHESILEEKKKIKRPGAGQTPNEWAQQIRERGRLLSKPNPTIKKTVTKFRTIHASALQHAKDKGWKKGRVEAYAMRTAIDKLPKWALKKPTKVHGPGESGQV